MFAGLRMLVLQVEKQPWPNKYQYNEFKRFRNRHVQRCFYKKIYDDQKKNIKFAFF